MENNNQQNSQTMTQPMNQQAIPPASSVQSQDGLTQQSTEYKKGSFFHRAIAYLIDAIILVLIEATLGTIAWLSKQDALYLLIYLVGFAYSIIFIGMKGATPGMKLLKLKVVSEKYQKIGYGTAFGRTLASILSNLALSFGYYWVLIDRKRQTWHDKLANTYVVKLDGNNNLIPSTGDEIITKVQKILFGFLVLLFPIGILGILLAITLIAINPVKQFGQANDAQRMSDVNAIENSILQYKTDNNGQLPQGITNIPTEISSEGVDICSELVPTYIYNLPFDPKLDDDAPTQDCQTPYKTGYFVSIDDQGLVTVSAPNAEIETSISVTR